MWAVLKKCVSMISWMRRVVCLRRQSLWLLLILVLVCIALQTYIARQARGEKELSGSQLRFTLTQEKSLSLVNVWEIIWPNSTPKLNHEPPSPQHSPKADANLQDVDIVKSKEVTTKSTTTTVKSRHISSPKPLPQLPPLGECKEKTHIVFLKTHKTASSTILNILYRFGESRNLTFALPLNKNSQLFYPSFFRLYFVEGALKRRFKEFHIMCNHMRFYKPEIAKVMPPDTYYFSILRNPVQMMESVFSYYKSIPAFQRTRTLEQFLNSTKTYYNASVAGNHYAHNLLAFDFGLNNSATSDSPDLEKHVSNAILAIERDFKLILISEHFDESMILLRHALCWSLEDVTSFKLNTRSDRTRKSLSTETVDKIKKWNALDWRIYSHFNATFWHKLETEIGWLRLEKEVSELRALQANFTTTCLKDGGAVEPSKIKDKGLKPFQYGAAVIQGYNLNSDLDSWTREMCERLILPELQYTNRMYMKQFPHYRALKPPQIPRQAGPRDQEIFVRPPPPVSRNKSAVL